jgi:hypothetical protein
VPRVRVEDFEDFEDDMEIDIKDDDAIDRAGRKIVPKQIPKQDRDWEEARREMIHRKYGRDRD